ncbi:MarR family winged helix-turn-helix transcriptional regulator [Photobacterium nomapromontoriensis]|uniref:MarR family winged helix-turn-helix transcriptional regulator n=1 Tax=Photobacterium nomapromontoriensis TaxID=2910237 RepID=UPI003D150F4C
MLPKYVALVDETKKYGLDSEAIALCGQLFTLNSQLTEECNQNLNKFGLLEGRFVAMLLIHSMGEAAPHELSTKTGLTRASITSIIDFLEKKGYATRIPSLSDRRSLSVRLMSEGESVLDEVLTYQLQWLEKITEPLTSEERATLKHLLGKISANR